MLCIRYIRPTVVWQRRISEAMITLRADKEQNHPRFLSF
jgi:hypothetical protein